MLLLQDEKEESEGSNKLLSQNDIETSRREIQDVAELKEYYDVLNSILPGGCSAPPLRFFAHNSEREKGNSTKFGDFS